MSENGHGRDARGLVLDTLEALDKRAERLEAFDTELKETRRLKGALEKALGIEPERLLRSAGPNHVESFRKRIEAYVAEQIEPVVAQEIVDAAGGKSLEWAEKMVLRPMVKNGRLCEPEPGRYGKPVVAVAAME